MGHPLLVLMDHSPLVLMDHSPLVLMDHPQATTIDNQASAANKKENIWAQALDGGGGGKEQKNERLMEAKT